MCKGYFEIRFGKQTAECNLGCVLMQRHQQLVEESQRLTELLTRYLDLRASLTQTQRKHYTRVPPSFNFFLFVCFFLDVCHIPAV